MFIQQLKPGHALWKDAAGRKRNEEERTDGTGTGGKRTSGKATG